MNSKQPSPPLWILRWFRWFCKPELHPYLEGDLLEHFQLLAEEAGRSKARNKMVLDIIRLMRPGIVRSFLPTQKLNTAMFKHSFKITFRNFSRYKATFLINLTGLTSGLTAVLFIFLWVQDELKMDRFHENGDQVYQVMMNFANGENIMTVDWTPAPLSKGVRNEMPEVLASATVYAPRSQGILSWNNGPEIRANELYAGPDFFNIFSFPLISGDKSKVLENERSVIISESLALKLFNRTDNLVGELLKFNQPELAGDYMVTGVFKDIPRYSTLLFDAVFSFDRFLAGNPDFDNWAYNDPQTYLKLAPSTDPSVFSSSLSQLVKGKPNVAADSIFIRSYENRYLYGRFENGIQSGGRIIYIRLFVTIAGLILLIACINFMNLSTAQATRRIKEVGVKKAIGSHKSALVFQFLSESMILSWLALLTALGLVVLLLPYFNAVVDKDITLTWNSSQLLALAAIAIVTGLVSGSYPAFYLSGFTPLQLLKRKFSSGGHQLWIRKGMVVFQFTISVILIVSIAVAHRQVELIQNKNLGYDREQVVIFPVEGETGADVNTFLNGLRNVPGVRYATASDHSILQNGTATRGVLWEGKDPQDATAFSYINANFDYVETLGIELVAGRSFAKERANDRQKVMVNETAIQAMGLENPVGQVITVWGENREIIGVMKDFHFESLYEAVKPLFYKISKADNDILVRMEAGAEAATLTRIQAYYEEFNNGLAFDFRFLDSQYQQLYTSETRVSQLSRYFALIALIISCLGLFALATFSAERRTKEIGIRKALGSSTVAVVKLLTAEFTRMVLVSIVIGLPLSYFIVQDWLADFVYRIELSAWFFLLFGVLALLIAWITVSFQTLRAARVRPVESLRYE